MSKMIHTPGVVSVTDNGNNSATFSIEPLHNGYGMTLGNSLRRVALSSIAGAAITGVKFAGASHEFTTVPNIKEDVVEIILNLKGVVFRVFGDNDVQTVRLSKKGQGLVTAGDITTTGDVEVVNADHVIATIDDAKGSLELEINIEVGRGYRTVEEVSSQKTAADVIAVDAIFSPVRRVRYNVENTRVGQKTDFDKLLLTIDTDSSITPQDAFEEAAAILVNQYTALAGQTRVEAAAQVSTGSSDAPSADLSDDSPALLTSIEDLNLTARTTNALVNNDIHTVKDLFSLSDAELRDLKGFGSKALDEVKEKMAEMEF